MKDENSDEGRVLTMSAISRTEAFHPSSVRLHPSPVVPPPSSFILPPSSFNTLVAEAAACRRCPEMCDRTAVLSALNGHLNARIMFIGEAPGRKGADRTHVPFSGDQSGANFDRFLASINLPRDQIFITSAAICNPRTPSGANRKPTKQELANCSDFLRRTFEIIDPAVVVTLGSVALEAIKRIAKHELTLKAAGTIHHWYGRLLIPIYHPSPQVLASHRREAEQLADYKVVAQAICTTDIPVCQADS